MIGLISFGLLEACYTFFLQSHQRGIENSRTLINSDIHNTQHNIFVVVVVIAVDAFTTISFGLAGCALIERASERRVLKPVLIEQLAGRRRLTNRIPFVATLTTWRGGFSNPNRRRRRTAHTSHRAGFRRKNIKQRGEGTAEKKKKRNQRRCDNDVSRGRARSRTTKNNHMQPRDLKRPICAFKQ